MTLDYLVLRLRSNYVNKDQVEKIVMQINTDISAVSNIPLTKSHLRTTDESETKTRDAQKTRVEQKEIKEPRKSAHGVLRLLEAGHFKGAADARLRINFSDQLAQQAEEVTNDDVEKKPRTVEGDDLLNAPAEDLLLAQYDQLRLNGTQLDISA